MNDPIHLTIIYGSDRNGRLCDTVVDWVLARIRQHDNFLLDYIDPALTPDPTELQQQLTRSDAFLVVTPEYNHGYPAALKSLIDSASREWHAKPVAFVSYGGVSGGLRAVEQLRQVFAGLHTVPIRNALSFAHIWSWLDENGTLATPVEMQLAMNKVLEQLNWWALTLRTARDTRPYEQANEQESA